MFPRLASRCRRRARLVQTARRRLVRGVATPEEMRTALRGLPFNPTTEMDLSCGPSRGAARDDRGVAAALADRTPARARRRLPSRRAAAVAAGGLASFLARYGHRGGRGDRHRRGALVRGPDHVLGAIANYLAPGRGCAAPDVQFARGAREARSRRSPTLVARVHGRRRVLRAAAARVACARSRACARRRSSSSSACSRAAARSAPVGAALAARGRLARGRGHCSCTIPELAAALAGEDMRADRRGARGESRASERAGTCRACSCPMGQMPRRPARRRPRTAGSAARRPRPGGSRAARAGDPRPGRRAHRARGDPRRARRPIRAGRRCS